MESDFLPKLVFKVVFFLAQIPMKKITVMHVITRFDKGGSAQNTYLSVLGLKRNHFHTVLVSGRTLESEMKSEETEALNEDIQILQSENIEFIQCPSLVRKISLINDIRALIYIVRIIRKHKPQIVHTHTSKAGLLGRLAAKLCGVPIILHTPHGHVFFGYFSPIQSKLFVFLEKWASLITDRIVTLTDREKRDHLVYKIAKERKLSVIFSGVDLRKFKEISLTRKQELKQILGIPERSQIVGTVGRLVPVKGLEYFIEAAHYILLKHPHTYFLIVGDGSLREELETKAQKLGIDKNLLFLGWREDVDVILSLFDIFVLSSLNEGMGRVLVEAMALGKPIVASDVGGIPDLVIHNKNGLLVRPKKSKELADNIQILMENEKKREEMGNEGNGIVFKYSADKMVIQIICLYTDLLRTKGLLSD